MRLNELIDRYEVEYLPSTISQARTKSCLNRLRSIDLDLEAINYGTLVSYRSKRSEEVCGATINREMAILGSVFTWARKSGLTNYRPDIPRTKETPRAHAATEEQVQKLIDNAEDLRLKAYIVLMFLTGQRKTAILELKRSQVKRTFIDFTEADGDPLASRRKRRAIVPIRPGIRKILNILKAQYGNTEYVLPDCQDGFTLDRMFAKLADSCSLGWITPHVIRHSACSVALDKGASIQEVSELLGHSSIKITEHSYKHMKPSFLNDTTDKLAGAIKL